MTDIRQLIQQTIELEGLLKILLEREDAHARQLLADKYDEFCAHMDVFVNGDNCMNEDMTSVKDDELEETQVKPEIVAAEQAVEHEEKSMQSATPAVSEPIEIAEPIEHVSLQAEEMAVPNTAPLESVTQPEAEPVAVRLPHQRNNALLRAFTLNDKFRFIREVFDGDERDFNDTLSLIADMDTFAEAEEYITGDMMLDKENPGVAEFLDFIAPYMKH